MLEWRLVGLIATPHKFVGVSPTPYTWRRPSDNTQYRGTEGLEVAVEKAGKTEVEKAELKAEIFSGT